MQAQKTKPRPHRFWHRTFPARIATLFISLLCMLLANGLSTSAYATPTTNNTLSSCSSSQSIAPWSLLNAQVRFDKDTILLTLHGKTRVIAHDLASRIGLIRK